MMVALILEERLMSEKKKRRSWTPDERSRETLRRDVILACVAGIEDALAMRA